MTAPSNRMQLIAPLALLGCATMTLRLVVGGEARLLVRSGLVPFVVAAAVVLAALAVIGLRAHRRPRASESSASPAAAAAAEPDRGIPRVTWALLGPFVASCLFVPGAVGAVADSQTPSPPQAPAGGVFRALPPGDPLLLSVTTYSDRSLLGGGDTLAGRELALVGFVRPLPGIGGWTVTRLRLRCCLADARPVRVRVLHAPVPPTASWVRVQGQYVPASEDGLPQIQASSVVSVSTPPDPYGA